MKISDFFDDIISQTKRGVRFNLFLKHFEKKLILSNLMSNFWLLRYVQYQACLFLWIILQKSKNLRISVCSRCLTPMGLFIYWEMCRCPFRYTVFLNDTSWRTWCSRESEGTCREWKVQQSISVLPCCWWHLLMFSLGTFGSLKLLPVGSS